ncbi:DUF2087 domain-containing protein [Aestuariimicrobium soli]|uniref:DUF2087 domain-containing protein n=1 Tax=Aestuariimicrobium soli TaxID=2035834 RepID=UPI003EB8D32B
MHARDRHRAAIVIHELTRPTGAAVIAALPARPGGTAPADEVRARTGMATATFWTTVGRLVDVGVVARTGDQLALDRDSLATLTSGLVEQGRWRAIGVDHPRLAAFVRFGRVTRMPTDPALAAELYAALAGLFDPGETLTEDEVNARIDEVHDDPAAIRRELVDRGWLERAPGSSTYRSASAGRFSDRRPGTW